MELIKRIVFSRKAAGSRKQEAGSRKQEAGSRPERRADSSDVCSLRSIAQVGSFALLVASGLLGAQTTIPAVQVTGTRPSTDGGQLICLTGSCNRLFANFQIPQLINNEISILQEIDRGAFCEQLKGQQPSGCPNSLSAAPRVPGLNTQLDDFLRSSGVNGCGTGFVSNLLVEGAAAIAYPGFNNLNSPILGLNFQSACDAHDACFAQQRGFETCNSEFLTALSIEVDRHGFAAGSEIRQWAEVFRSAYHAAVATEVGRSAYGRAAAAYACAAWNVEMEMNQCPRN